jgi:cytosine deaminase
VLIVPPASSGIPGGPGTHPLLLRGARLPDGRIEDVTVADGVIVCVGGNPAGDPPRQLVDLSGYLLLPSLVEPHAHLGLTGPGGAIGRLAAGRGRWVTGRSGPAKADIATLAWSSAARYLAAGTTAIRVHLDVGTESGLRAVEALLEVRAGLAGILDIQIVAAVSAPLTGRAGAASRALLRHALAAGADLAGAGPGVGDETRRTVEDLAADAAGAGVGLDVHIDETAGPAPRWLGRLNAIAEAGFGHPLTISHLASLGTRK